MVAGERRRPRPIEIPKCGDGPSHVEQRRHNGFTRRRDQGGRVTRKRARFKFIPSLPTEGHKRLYSCRDDVTLAHPFGPPARGWESVSERRDGAAANYRDGEVVELENVSTVIGADIGYTVEIGSYRARVGGSEEMSDVAVRVTTAFRREDGEWKVIHRYADPITE